MKTLWNFVRAVFVVTGAYVWIKAIDEVYKERNTEPEPIVRPVMFGIGDSK